MSSSFLQAQKEALKSFLYSLWSSFVVSFFSKIQTSKINLDDVAERDVDLLLAAKKILGREKVEKIMEEAAKFCYKPTDSDLRKVLKYIVVELRKNGIQLSDGVESWILRNLRRMRDELLRVMTKYCSSQQSTTIS